MHKQQSICVQSHLKDFLLLKSLHEILKSLLYLGSFLSLILIFMLVTDLNLHSKTVGQSASGFLGNS